MSAPDAFDRARPLIMEGTAALARGDFLAASNLFAVARHELILDCYPGEGLIRELANQSDKAMAELRAGPH